MELGTAPRDISPQSLEPASARSSATCPTQLTPKSPSSSPTSAPPSNPEGADHDDLQDCRSTSVAGSLHLHSSIDDGASPLQPGEHRAPVQSGEQGAGSRLEPAADPNPRSRPRSVRRANDPSRRLHAARPRSGH